MNKISQANANYRNGNPQSCCGLCKYFEGAAHGTCTRVAGRISPFMISDVYEAAPNPTGTTYNHPPAPAGAGSRGQTPPMER